MSEPSEKDLEALRIRARERIEQGLLPRAKAVRTWGGLGSGLRCDLCDAAITASEPEFELQIDLALSAESVRFHRQCHTIWNEAREQHQRGGWRSVEHDPPPIGALVEARISLGETRSVILSITRLAELQPTTTEPDASGGWINATTGGPLPIGWRPLEWRPPPTGAQPNVGRQTESTESAAGGREADTAASPLPRRA